MNAKTARFEVDQKIGNGTYGTVYKCFDQKLKRTVAIKKMKQTTIENYGIPGVILREIAILSSLDHPNVVKLLEVIYEKDILLVFSYSDSNLQTVLQSIPATTFLTEKEVKVL